MLFSPPKGLAVTGEVLSIDMDANRVSVREDGAMSPRVFRVRECGLLQTISSGDWVRVDSADNQTADSISRL
jgi:hypothetical protein